MERSNVNTHMNAFLVFGSVMVSQMTVPATPMKKVVQIVLGYTVTTMKHLFHGLRSVTSDPNVRMHQMKTTANTDALVAYILNVPPDLVFSELGNVITSLIAGQLERTKLVA
ncbi:unnamed protein product, partial [Allacma fusca]